jgi:LuxR family maltose regulon positive regulatory protein
VEASLLRNKLNIPPVRLQTIPCSRLIDQLREGLNYSLILVSAPAGFGKTILLSDWINVSKPSIRTACVSLGEGDNDPVRFWDYFIAALRILQPDCGQKILPLLHSSQHPSVEPIVTALINDLALIEDNFVIVLDDYHVIDSPSEGFTFLSYRHD